MPEQTEVHGLGEINAARLKRTPVREEGNIVAYKKDLWVTLCIPADAVDANAVIELAGERVHFSLSASQLTLFPKSGGGKGKSPDPDSAGALFEDGNPDAGARPGSDAVPPARKRKPKAGAAKGAPSKRGKATGKGKAAESTADGAE